MDTPSAPPDRALAVEDGARLALAGLACALTVLVGFSLRQWLDGPNLIMLFLLDVVVVARWLGPAPAVLSAFLSVAAFDFFFVPPHLSFAVSDFQYLWTFAVMLFVALLIAHLTTGLRQTALDAEARAWTSAALYRLSRQLGRAANRGQLTSAISEAGLVVPGLECRVYLLDGKGALQSVDPAPVLEGLELIAARAALQAGAPRISPNLTPDDRPLMVLPLRGSGQGLGVLLAVPGSGSKHELQRHQPTLESIAVILAATVERLKSVENAQQTQLAIVTERLRNSILAAISHDLRTPLATLFGSADALLMDAEPIPASQRENLLAIHEQALHLNTMVGNLLELARLHGDDFQLRKEWQPLEEVLGTSLKLLGRALERHPVTLALDPGLPLLEFDAVLIERVLCNLLDNALRHAPADSPITIGARLAGGEAVISVCNAGSEMPPALLAALNEADPRTPETDERRGLGLSICKAIVAAHDGRLSASNEADGVCVSFTLPLGVPPPFPVDPEDEAGEVQEHPP